jgi:hypothetical protein
MNGSETNYEIRGISTLEVLLHMFTHRFDVRDRIEEVKTVCTHGPCMHDTDTDRASTYPPVDPRNAMHACSGLCKALIKSGPRQAGAKIIAIAVLV